jgi:hypothetical protein
VVLQKVAGHRIGEDISDLEQWLRALEGCPTVTHTVAAQCPSDAHTDEPGTWFYVEADAGAGVVRRRCLSCGFVVSTLDSDARWNHPRMWACATCGQSITEVVAGLHAPAEHPSENLSPGPVSWVAIGVRCVGCGSLDGVTDFVLVPTPYTEVVDKL